MTGVTSAALFSLTVFLGAGLLFAVQPMVGKMLLPFVGGAPAVWNTCLVFFQLALLVGYGYAHVTVTRLDRRQQVMLHLALAFVACAVLPVRVRDRPMASFSVEQPIPWLLLALGLGVGLPFVVVSATGPLVQRWFTETQPLRNDPYVLYAASNLGSFAALLGYPLLLEPQLSLARQNRLWLGGYLALIGLLAVCGLRSMWCARADLGTTTPVREAVDRTDLRARLRWVALAAVPSSYLLGVTTFLTTDVAAVPLLWVIPLALYLLSFVIVFAPGTARSHRGLARTFPALALLIVLVTVSGMALPLAVLLPLHLLAFFVASVMCHGELARNRPAASRLTEYYVLLALGGALGGAFNALVAPLLFHRVLEYPLAIVLACLLRPSAQRTEAPAGLGIARRDVVLSLAVACLTAGFVLGARWFGLAAGRAGVAAVFGVPAIVCYTFVERPARFALGLLALLLAGQLHTGPQGRPLHEVRTFFGVLRVTVDDEGRFRQLVHGTTFHGRQRVGDASHAEPLSYYHPSGPAGDVFRYVRRDTGQPAVGVIGLGVGSLCAYARADEEWVFYEIDAAVERIARDPAFFTFWRDCRAQRRSVVVGDARLRLAEASDGRYAILIVDAFSSDAIPIHLLTREALALYRRKSAPHGWIVLHVSSQHLDLMPIVAGLAADAGALAYARDDLVLGAAERRAGKDPSRWAVIAQTRSDLGALADDPRWRPLPAPTGRVWTDDYSNLWTVITLR